MGILTEYFAAPSDEAAATVLQDPGGPSAPGQTSGRPRFDSVELPSVDPFVMLGTLAEMLCGLPYGEVTAQPRHGMLVGSAGDEGPWVVTLSDILVADLAAAQPNRLADTVRAWTRTHAVNAPPHRLVAGVVALSSLAGRAVISRHHVYCWTSLSD